MLNGMLKWFRRIAARYDKLDASFLAFVYLARYRYFVDLALIPQFFKRRLKHSTSCYSL